ncbi:MAG: tyrosine-type recombinase/integrase [Thaumarchaeota archaeon]|nr:tyrosine-type recombinase/integrase [Nitrososphaerota archaeon]
MDRSLLVFEKYVRSEATKKSYLYHFNRFLNWSKIKNGDGILQLRESALQEMVEDYVFYLRSRISPNSFQPIVASLQLFFSMNDKILNWDKIKRMVPTQVKKSGHLAYQTEDVKKMLEGEHLRGRTLVHFLASTGCRLGAIPELKLKHVENMSHNCKCIKIYEGSNEEYQTFLTPEASKVLDEYLEKRKRDGEYLNEESPLFRASYQVGIQKVKPMGLEALRQVMQRVIRKTSVRKKITESRYNIMGVHGLRKRYGTIIKLNKDIPYSVGERLLGHQIDLDPSYFRPTRENLFDAWLKIMPELIVSDGERQRIRAENAEKKAELLESEKDKRIVELETKHRETQEQIRGLYELLGKKD